MPIYKSDLPKYIQRLQLYRGWFYSFTLQKTPS
jgi:hypothetical protein